MDFDWAQAEADVSSVSLAERALMAYSVLKADRERDLLLGAANIFRLILGPGHEFGDVKVKTFPSVDNGQVDARIGSLDFRAFWLADSEGGGEWSLRVRTSTTEHGFMKFDSVAELGRILAEHDFYKAAREQENWQLWMS